MFILLFNYIYNERKHDFKLNVSTYVCSWTFCNYNDKHAWWSIMNNCLDGPSSDIRDIDLLIVCFLRELPVSLKNKYWYKWHTYLSTWIYFYFYITVSLKKKIPFTKTRIKLIHRIKQKIEPLMLHGSRQIGKKNTVFASSEHKDSSCIPLFNILISRIFWEIYR